MPHRGLYRVAQPLRGNLDDATLFVIMGFEAVHQDLFVRPAEDPVVALDAGVLERIHSEVAEAHFRVVLPALAGNEGNHLVELEA